MNTLQIKEKIKEEHHGHTCNETKQWEGPASKHRGGSGERFERGQYSWCPHCSFPCCLPLQIGESWAEAAAPVSISAKTLSPTACLHMRALQQQKPTLKKMMVIEKRKKQGVLDLCLSLHASRPLSAACRAHRSLEMQRFQALVADTPSSNDTLSCVTITSLIRKTQCAKCLTLIKEVSLAMAGKLCPAQNLLDQGKKTHLISYQ